MGEYDKYLLDKNSSTYKRRIIVRVITLVLVLAVSTYLVFKLYPYVEFIKTKEGRQYLKSIVDDNMLKGVLLFIACQALQVIIPVLPPLQIVSGMLFGSVLGTLLSILGIVLGSTVVFFLVKWLGYSFVQTMLDEKKLHRFKFLYDENKVVTIMAIMFLVPGFPKDMLTFVLPLTKMSKKDFFFVIMPARVPALVLSSVVGGCIRSENYIAAGVFSVCVLALSVIGILYRDKIVEKFHREHSKNK